MTPRRTVAALAAAVSLAGCGTTAESKFGRGADVPIASSVSPDAKPTLSPQDRAFAALTSPGTELATPVQLPTHGIRLVPASRDAHPKVPAANALANPVVRGMFGPKHTPSPGIKLAVLYDDEIRHLNADGSSTKLYYGVTVWAVAGSVVSEPGGPSSGGGVGPHGETADNAGGDAMAHLVVFINAETGRYLFAIEGDV